MTIQTFTAGQTLTADALNTLQASDFNFTKNVQSGTSYTLVLSDLGKLIEFQNTGNSTLTIPPNSSTAFTLGDRVDILLASVGSLSVVGGDGVTINAEGNLTTLSSRWTRATLIKIGTDSWVMTGGSSAVQTAEIDDGAVTTLKLAAGAVTTVKLADDSVTSAKIVDGTIVNADINASAAIDKTKISGTAITAADTGTVTSTMIADGTIVNADVNASAGIALSKLASGASGQLIIHSSSGVPTATTVSGDVTIDHSGNVQIAADKIVDADINASAAIDLGKLADATIDEKSASYTLALTDKNKFIKMSVTSTANTVTVPTNASVAFPIGSQIHIIQYGTGKTQVIPVSGTVILYATPGAYLRAQYSSATLLKCDTNIWMLMGDLSAS